MSNADFNEEQFEAEKKAALDAAVAAERERCARLAESFDTSGQAQGSFELLADIIRGLPR